MTALEAWLEGAYAGQFVFGGGSQVEFVYDENAPETPISLSLPRDGQHSRSAAAFFLENLLPENSLVRERMARSYAAPSPSTYDLLSAAGGDVAGGLVLLPEGQSPQTLAAELNPALSRDIADRIAAIKRDASDSAPPDGIARFSLAGAQSKFALAWVDGDWYWPNATVPSTHIIKPGSGLYPGIERAESAAMLLAWHTSVGAPQAEVLSFGDQTSYVIERFDREAVGDGVARRLHMEDLAQSFGMPPDKKYNLSARQVLEALAPVDPDYVIRERFIQQLVFNTLVGNADAHVKNYSLMLRPTGVSMSPTYDVVPLFFFPAVEQRLAMKIGGAQRSQEITLDRWRKFARAALPLTPGVERVVELVQGVASNVVDHVESVWQEVDPERAAQAREFIRANATRVRGN